MTASGGYDITPTRQRTPDRAEGTPAEPAAAEASGLGIVAVPGVAFTGGGLHRHAATGDDPLGGTSAAPAVADALRRRRGGGRPLDEATADEFGAHLGVDLSPVRLHTDAEADSIARSVQATAFTHGTDVYFTRGSFDPASTRGQHLLAHELAHVAQGTNGRDAASAGTPMIGPAADPAEIEADRVADAMVPRLRRRTAGAPAPVSTVPPRVRRERDLATIRRLGVKKLISGAKTKARTFFGKAAPVPDQTTGNQVIDSMSHQERMTHQRRARGQGPGENPDYTDPTLWGEQPNRFQITLAAVQEHPAWMENIQALRNTALRQMVTSPRQFVAGMSKPDRYLVEKTLQRRGDLDGKSEAERKQLMKQFTADIHELGHTWVRLSTFVGNRLKEVYSYGMYPQKLYVPVGGDEHGGYQDPTKPVAGEVRHPDVVHENDDGKVFKDYDLKRSQFDSGLARAVERYNNPPPYVLTGYNCTAFVREILKASGKSYPGKGILPGFAYTPADLYLRIEKEIAKKNPSARNEDDDQTKAAMTALTTRASAFRDAGRANVLDEHLQTAYRLPPPGQAREPVTLRGETINCGTDPANLDPTRLPDADLQVRWINAPEVIKQYRVVPVEAASREAVQVFGPSVVFIQLSDFVNVVVPAAGSKVNELIRSAGLPYYVTDQAPKSYSIARGRWRADQLAGLELANAFHSDASAEWVQLYSQQDGLTFWVRRELLPAFKSDLGDSFDSLYRDAQPRSHDGDEDSASGKGKAPADSDDERESGYQQNGGGDFIGLFDTDDTDDSDEELEQNFGADMQAALELFHSYRNEPKGSVRAWMDAGRTYQGHFIDIDWLNGQLKGPGGQAAARALAKAIGWSVEEITSYFA